MFHASLTHFPVFFFNPFIPSLLQSGYFMLFYLPVYWSSPSLPHLLLHLSIEFLISIYYVRISLVKSSISSSTFLNMLIFFKACVQWLQHLNHLLKLVAIIWGSFWGPLESFFSFCWVVHIMDRSPYFTQGLRGFEDGFLSLQKDCLFLVHPYFLGIDLLGN